MGCGSLWPVRYAASPIFYALSVLLPRAVFAILGARTGSEACRRRVVTAAVQWLQRAAAVGGLASTDNAALFCAALRCVEMFRGLLTIDQLLVALAAMQGAAPCGMSVA